MKKKKEHFPVFLVPGLLTSSKNNVNAVEAQRAAIEARATGGEAP
ncbi:MAG: hypothetical protein ACOZBH_00845 [Patescibacteria group bacterium]